MVLFVLVESKVKCPLLPLRVATERNRAAAFLASFLSGAVLIGGILFINFYLQIVLGFAPFMPSTIAAAATAGGASMAALSAGYAAVFLWALRGSRS